AATAEFIGNGNLHARADITLNDEIGSLAQSLNKMVERITSITVSRDKLTEEIAHRKEVEKKLSQFKLTLDQTLDCVFMFAPDTLKFFYVNQGAVNQAGFTREEFSDMTPLDIKPKFTEEKFQRMVAPLLDGSKKSHIFQTKHQHKNGTRIPVEVLLQFVRLPGEENGCFLAIVRDITERKKSRQRLKKILDTVDAMIYVADIDTCEILHTNRYVKKHFGNIIGKTCWEAIQGQNAPCPFCQYRNIYENGRLHPEAHVWQIQNCRNGEWYECRDQGIQWVDGRAARIQVATNISKRKKIEEEREQLINELQSALSEIKVLRGILPICSFCKNIRNDDGYYEQIEAYIHKHSGVDFSHTVCPTCMKEHYPDEYKIIFQKMIHDATFGIAVLLGTGLAIAKLAQMLRLPSVTGFILAGLLLGESGLSIITVDLLGHQLDHFTSIALMLIAFGIGEHVELRRLDGMGRDVTYIAIIQGLAAFILVTLATLYTTWLVSGAESITRHHLILAMLLGAIAVAT
ncbi:PAS domain S-box protein, partial [Desulfobulbus sp. US2]|nr:PAS domain S-box protein [Desulfobulbus sp. US2]